MTNRTRGRLTAVLVAVSLAVGGVAVPAATAHAAPSAPPLEEARRKALALRKAVDKLELQAAVAVEDYNEAQDELARAVSARLAAQGQLDQARAVADADSDKFEQRIRAIYMTGGTMTLYASLMEAPDLHDAFGRLANVNSVLRRDGVTSDAAGDTVVAAEAAAVRLREVALEQTRLEKRVAEHARRVEAALAQQKTLLAQADATVKRLAEEERKRAEEAARRAFERRVAEERARARAAAAAAARAAGQEGVPATSGAPGTTGQVTTGAAIAALASDSTTPPNPVVAKAIAAAKSKIGRPYLWGAVGPDSFDCSGLTGWAYRQAGLNLPRTSRQQWFAGTHPDIGSLLPGDLLFWGPDRSNPQSIHHVALYIGAGMMIAAPRTGTFVRIQPVYLGDFFGVTRPT